MDGPRITESGDFRITETSDARVTEGFFEGFASIEASSSIESLGGITLGGAANLSSSESVLLVGEAVLFGRVSASASSSISPSGYLLFNVFSDLSSEAALYGKAGFKFSGQFIDLQYSAMFAEQSFIADGRFGEILESFTRVTESGDVRVTEDSDTRVTGLIPQNLFFSTLVSDPTRRPFAKTIHAKYDGDWLASSMHVKYNGIWNIPDRAYQNINGNWKRIA
jgi:hypothetical protein